MRSAQKLTTACMTSRSLAYAIAFGLLSSVATISNFSTQEVLAQETTTISPLKEVQATVEMIVKAVETLPGDANIEPRRKKLREIIDPRFDFREMSRRSLGSFWGQITPEQQEEFVTIFSNLLSRTYLNRIETVKRGMVEMKGENIRPPVSEGEPPTALVNTIVNSKGQIFPLDYKLVLEKTQWRVYDVVIESVGLVATYRNEFAGIIRKEKFDGLMAKLKEKLATN